MARTVLLFIVLTTAMSIKIVHTAVVPSPPTVNLTQFRNAELQKHNQYRSKHDCQSIKLDNTLNAAAQAYAEKLASIHTLQHSQAAKDGKYG